MDHRPPKSALASCLISLILAAPSALSASRTKEVWTFMAYAGPYGRFKATTTIDTLMVDNGVFRYSVQGPNYELFTVLNPENKSYIQTTVSQYATEWAPSIWYPRLKKIGKGKVLELDCAHYQSEPLRSGLGAGTIIDAWFTNAIPMNKGLTDSFCKVCGLPGGYGLPVKFQFKGRTRTQLMFELLKAGKNRVAVESLLVPKSYRHMKDQALFFLSDEDGHNSGVDELMRSVRKTPKGK